MLAGLGSALVRHGLPGGTDAFNLGIDFKGGTVVTADFKQRPAPRSYATRCTRLASQTPSSSPSQTTPDRCS